MGYEIGGGLGVKLAAPDREVFVLAATARKPADLAANAAGRSAAVLRASTTEEFVAARAAAREEARTTAVVRTDPLAPAPDSGPWWDVPDAEVSELDADRDARTAYGNARKEHATRL
jgi:3D-(3,5/4)-trihydroxycyclohexane-1,2-dione acylhydrolase (decyclizing)